MITSPWFPNPYEDNKNCVYDIIAPLGKAIVLNFTDFNIEDDCDFDSLRIYDGVDSNGTLIGTYCGSERPPSAISTFNHLHLVFQTDSSNTGPGFKASYSFIDASTFECSMLYFKGKNMTNSNFRLWRCHKESESDNFTTTKRERLCTSLELQMDYCCAAWLFN